uniref:Secreted protein n=1 Tax=Plectus sambesii TaxID=2011161 RepID=A0A914WR31_9BILA
MKSALFFGAVIASCLCMCEAQLSAMFGNAIQAENCASWSPWGPCIWIKGDKPRWQRSYFEQLLPGRSGCRDHVFFKLVRERWNVAFTDINNCAIWPNPDIPLPNVTAPMRDIIDDLGYLSCVRETRPDRAVCRCCCHPFEPNPTTFKCQLKKGHTLDLVNQP